MRGFVSVLLVIACAALLGEGAYAELVEPPAAAVKQADDELAPRASTDDRAKHDEGTATEKPDR